MGALSRCNTSHPQTQEPKARLSQITLCLPRMGGWEKYANPRRSRQEARNGKWGAIEPIAPTQGALAMASYAFPANGKSERQMGFKGAADRAPAAQRRREAPGR